MGCLTTTELLNVSLDCNDVPVGGLKRVFIAGACQTALSIIDDRDNALFGTVEVLAFETESGNVGKVYELEFNKRDSATSFTDAKTVDASGIVSSIPTLTIEFPKMTNSKRNVLNDLATGVGNYLVFVETAAGTKHVLGAKFGMRVSEIKGTTGTGRTEKNAFTVTMVGDESELSYVINDMLWGNVVNKVSVDHFTAVGIDLDTEAIEGFVPRSSCAPRPTI